jgi:hypothetical protein
MPRIEERKIIGSYVNWTELASGFSLSELEQLKDNLNPHQHGLFYLLYCIPFPNFPINYHSLSKDSSMQLGRKTKIPIVKQEPIMLSS